MAMTRRPETWTIRITPLASTVPAANRVRRLLKYALRACGLRCTAVLDEPGERSPPACATGAALARISQMALSFRHGVCAFSRL
jgi:hypothetical protein